MSILSTTPKKPFRITILARNADKIGNKGWTVHSGVVWIAKQKIPFLKSKRDSFIGRPRPHRRRIIHRPFPRLIPRQPKRAKKKKRQAESATGLQLELTRATPRCRCRAWPWTPPRQRAARCRGRRRRRRLRRRRSWTWWRAPCSGWWRGTTRWRRWAAEGGGGGARSRDGGVRGGEGAPAPRIGVAQYLERVHRYAGLEPECYVVAYAYVDMAAHRRPAAAVASRNVHRLLLACLLVASKVLDDL